MSLLFYHFSSLRRQYQPLSLKRLQYLIDLGRVDTTQPIDVTQLMNSRGVTVQPLKRDYGVQLVEEVYICDTLNSLVLKACVMCCAMPFGRGGLLRK